jgi:hypothetical protein
MTMRKSHSCIAILSDHAIDGPLTFARLASTPPPWPLADVDILGGVSLYGMISLMQMHVDLQQDMTTNLFGAILLRSARVGRCSVFNTHFGR